MEGAKGKQFMCERLGSGKDDIKLLLVSGFTWVMFVSEGILIQKKKKSSVGPASPVGLCCAHPLLKGSLTTINDNHLAPLYSPKAPTSLEQILMTHENSFPT